jgi:hypothetical protein
MTKKKLPTSKKTPNRSSPKRTKIPVDVRYELLTEAGYKCGNPACRNIITLDLHHIEYVSSGGGNGPSNLLVLCPYCHSMHHAGHIPIEAIRLWKRLLVACSNAFDRASMDLLFFVKTTQDQQVWVTGDGLLRFAGLISAGLVFAESQYSIRAPGDPGRMFMQSTHRLKLTEKGALLTDAWRSGDEEAFRLLVSEPFGSSVGK